MLNRRDFLKYSSRALATIPLLSAGSACAFPESLSSKYYCVDVLFMIHCNCVVYQLVTEKYHALDTIYAS